MPASRVETFRTAHRAFNSRDFDAIGRLQSDDFSYQDNARNLSYKGRDAFREFMQGWVTAFSDAQVSEPRYIDAGDVVVAEFVGRGTHDGQLGPHAATGRKMALPFCEIMRFDGSGKIVSGGIYYDQVTMLAQLGLAQAASAAV